ncbi:hypothetical protein PN466_04020 [Roseofilum reptotaenium CS-1145]|uniref:Uncharacterized protein n=1 Tax=Roseofilum reptotaenium AO1-A TaxID=1925591 RepID=A0A1L9QQV0_9CYAN|nr:hypothetical protein [Roseofilum reptotaenium]MDB9516128.1 hypothetical protein [Roseofilum reptotaenium CS-1145]OJJ25075.1 hypothetical protein BI308_13635 [Roseofilum reptotaenium AO1-A]
MKSRSRQIKTSPKAYPIIQSMETLETVMSIDPKREIVQAINPVTSGLNSGLSLVLHVEFFILLCLHLFVLLQLKKR